MLKKNKQSMINYPRVSYWFVFIILLGQISTSIIQLTSMLYTGLINLTGNENLFWGIPFFEWSYSIVIIMGTKGILVANITAILLCLLLAILIYQIRCHINASLSLISLLILGLFDITLTIIAFFTNSSTGVISVATLFNPQISFILMIVYLSQILIGIGGIWLFRRFFFTEMTVNQSPFSKRHLYLIINLWGVILSNYLLHAIPSRFYSNLFFFITIMFRFTLIIATFINLKPTQSAQQKGYLVLLLVLILGLPLQRYHFQFSNVLIIITIAKYLIKSRQISSGEFTI
ncbi:hypothetical protein [Latilactobacillus graminis]|uniref:Uncharacterized protein n=2 Tax=Latilactobacillus graminis TaxID=60519 RepID=A0AA89I221_9LACO|nr:hypothetical protein [Latilactobacillus graminis]KRM23889.1 hypothetical protein FC90_GL001412 [Latilactobacillus graminis DSM 20719]QFP79778.1 hypothetical protein LG542_05760 [Latilactobacillus graminis]